MKVPKQIKALIDDGLVDEVLRQLMSGKEATIFIVRCGDKIRCAKVYKDASRRSFKKAVQYREGRPVRNSRRGRALEKVPGSEKRNKRKSGSIPKRMRYFCWHRPAYGFPSPTDASKACC